MEATLDAVTRDGVGKNEARRLRQAGQIPAVLYGGGRPALSISVDPKLLLRILHSGSGINTLIGLNLGGEASRVLVKEYQLDPISHRLLHVDFYKVAMDKPIAVKVPIVLKGEAQGVKLQGGLLDFVHREVEIECLPGEIPEHLVADVTSLMAGQNVRLRDLLEGVAWKPVSDPETVIAHVIPPRGESESETVAEPAGVAPAEPELIKKGKGEEAKDAKGEKA